MDAISCGSRLSASTRCTRHAHIDRFANARARPEQRLAISGRQARNSQTGVLWCRAESGPPGGHPSCASKTGCTNSVEIARAGLKELEQANSDADYRKAAEAVAGRLEELLGQPAPYPPPGGGSAIRGSIRPATAIVRVLQAARSDIMGLIRPSQIAH